MAVKLQTQNIRDIGIFERVTRVHVRDCVRDEVCVYFMIEPGKSGIAIGRNGSNIKSVARMLGKPAKVFEFADDIETMVKNMIPSAKGLEIEGDSVTVSIPKSERSMVIGRNGRNIKVMKEFLWRHYKVKNLRLR